MPDLDDRRSCFRRARVGDSFTHDLGRESFLDRVRRSRPGGLRGQAGGGPSGDDRGEKALARTIRDPVCRAHRRRAARRRQLRDLPERHVERASGWRVDDAIPPARERSGAMPLRLLGARSSQRRSVVRLAVLHGGGSRDGSRSERRPARAPTREARRRAARSGRRTGCDVSSAGAAGRARLPRRPPRASRDARPLLPRDVGVVGRPATTARPTG